MTEKEKAGNCIIIGAGDLTVGSIPYDADADYVIAADGGLMYLSVLGIEPDLIIGDGDSLGEDFKEAVEQIRLLAPEKIITLPTVKDDTDMLAAVKTGLKMGYRNFRLYGANGGRLEHTIANIQTLKFLKDQGAVGYMMDGTGMILIAQNETIRFQASMEGYINIFSMNEEARGVTLRGLKYALTDAVLTNNMPLGISNEFTGAEAEVTVKDGTLLILVNWVM